MGLFIYNLITQAYYLGIRLAANWNEKAKLWVKGRVGLIEKLTHEISAKRTDNQRLVWMHCASLGEFEQGRPVLEMLRKEHPEIKILLSFFSPSGYEIRKNYPIADWVTYLPADSATDASRFLDAVNPDLVIFVKYEFWYHYLTTLRERKIPTLLISAIFRPSQPFFKWYGRLHREMLGCFDEILVQDEASLELLGKINLKNVTLAGDNRVDRVLEIAKHPYSLPAVELFCGDAPVLVCGSTWPADEAMLTPIFTHENFKDWKFILAPHDVQPARLKEIESKLAVKTIRLTQLSNGNHSEARLLLVDNIGLLSSLYFFGKVAYIGGGFGQSIHNTLEPAAHSLPVVFGPKYHKFEEAVWLVERGGGFVVRNGQELIGVLENLSNPVQQQKAAVATKQYFVQRAGATQHVMDKLNTLLNR